MGQVLSWCPVSHLKNLIVRTCLILSYATWLSQRYSVQSCSLLLEYTPIPFVTVFMSSLSYFPREEGGFIYWTRRWINCGNICYSYFKTVCFPNNLSFKKKVQNLKAAVAQMTVFWILTLCRTSVPTFRNSRLPPYKTVHKAGVVIQRRKCFDCRKVAKTATTTLTTLQSLCKWRRHSSFKLSEQIYHTARFKNNRRFTN